MTEISTQSVVLDCHQFPERFVWTGLINNSIVTQIVIGGHVKISKFRRKMMRINQTHTTRCVGFIDSYITIHVHATKLYLIEDFPKITIANMAYTKQSDSQCLCFHFVMLPVMSR